MLHKTGLLTEVQVSKATSDLCLCPQTSSMKHMIMLARVESGEGSGKWEVGRVDRKEGGWGGVDGRGGWRQGGESGRGQRGGGDGEGSNRDGKRLAMGRGTR